MSDDPIRLVGQGLHGDEPFPEGYIDAVMTGKPHPETWEWVDGPMEWTGLVHFPKTIFNTPKDENVRPSEQTEENPS